MGHALTSTAACKAADAMALKEANLGAGARVLGCRRQSPGSYDLAYTLATAAGQEKSVVITDRALRMGLKKAGLAKA